jgi:hypothetical protein
VNSAASSITLFSPPSWPSRLLPRGRIFAKRLWPAILSFVVLAALANVLYSAAYCADVFVQYASFRQLWRHRRGALIATGTLFAIILANYWIADEIYSYVPYVR